MSGDMFLGALAELTGAYDHLRQLPEMLHLKKVEVKISDVVKAGIACRHIKILDHNQYPQHVLSSNKERSATDIDSDTTFAPATTTPAHHHHRHLKDIEKIIDEAEIPGTAKQIAKDIFMLLGQAESRVHGVDINTIHFHEVGAIDSILDIVGTAFLLDKLNIDTTVSTPICTGHGFVMADHGKMPIPAPATKELLLNMPTYAGEERGEMVTPTGAAILKYLQPDFEIPVLTEQRIGHGPGEKDFIHPNVLRLSLCEATAGAEEVYVIETNIDDMPAELLGQDFQEGLLKAGALDLYFSQVVMKKGRPGVVITALACRENLRQVADFLLQQTSTIGVRYYVANRKVLKRHSKSIKTSLGEVDIKIVELPSGNKRTTLEYESAKKLALQTGMPIAEVYQRLSKEI